MFLFAAETLHTVVFQFDVLNVEMGLEGELLPMKGCLQQPARQGSNFVETWFLLCIVEKAYKSTA